MKNSFICAALILLACEFSLGQTFKVIHDFQGFPNDGSYTTASLIFDRAGNLYGASGGGGNSTAPPCSGAPGCGVIFELSQEKDGSWSETVLYNFCSDFDGEKCVDGDAPYAGVAMDSAGSLYGTTVTGGAGECSGFNCGTVFKLSAPNKDGGSWTESILYNFCSDNRGGECLDGQAPTGQLAFDASGNIYGTTAGGGSGHIAGGTVFELSPQGGRWLEKVLYSFCSQGTGDSCPDGNNPSAGVTLDHSGDLYGTTDYSGNENTATGGTVYRLTPGANGWSHTLILAVPPQSKSSILQGPVSFDSIGNLYSTFSAPFGGVFRMNLKSKRITVLSFNGSDGLDPIGGVLVNERVDALYGTTSGSATGPGNIFEIGKSGKETVMHKFCSWANCTDGEIPWSTLVADEAGNLYGTTEFGGAYGRGVVFEITP